MLSQIKQAKYNILLKENILPFFVPLIVSIAIWWNPNFLVPDTYYNIGDTVFPLSPSLYLDKISSSWIYDELGFPNLTPTIIPPYCIIFLLDFFSVPLWIVNRLWLVIPTAMVGWSTYYLFKSVFKGRYTTTSGIIASMFAMLPPEISAIPLWYISLSGFSFTLGALIRGLNSEKLMWKYPVLISLGSVLLLGNPRCFYLSIITIFIYVSVHFFLNRTLIANKIKFLLIAAIVVFVANAFWLAPTVSYYMSGNPSLKANLAGEAKAGNEQLTILNLYLHSSKLMRVGRLMRSGTFPTLDYIKQPFIYPFTFIMPLCVLASFFLVKNNKSFVPLKIITPFFFFFAVSLHFTITSKIYLYFFEHLPGFIILNSPIYWILILGVLFAVLAGATIQALLQKIDGSSTTSQLKKTLIVLLIAIQVVLITIVYGGGVLIGGPKDNLGSGNHISAAKVPEEYFGLEKYLLEKASDGNRILSLPLVNDPYRRYTWFYVKTMPEIIHSVSPIPVCGLPQSPATVKSAVILLKKGDIVAFQIFKELGIRFVLLHKDYYKSSEGFNPEDVAEYEKKFRNNVYIRKVMENKYFSLYELTEESVPSIYSISESLNDSTPKKIDAEGIINLLKFTGNNHLFLGSPDALTFKSEFTISSWIYAEDVLASQGILTKWAGSGDKYDDYGVLVAKGKVWYFVNIDGHDIIPAAGNLIHNKWYHIVMTYDSNKREIICFINGIPVGLFTIHEEMKQIIPSDTPVLIGAHNGLRPSQYFHGYITNIQLYGQQLTITEIKKLFNSGIDGSAMEKRDLRGWWKTDAEHINDNIVRDLSGRGNHAEINGEKLFEKTKYSNNMRYVSANTNTQTVGIEYKKLSETKYKAKVSGNESFDLVLNQAFHPLWKCIIDGKEIKEHYPTELGMNRWHIMDANNKEIVVLFSPQKWLDVGLFISCLYVLIITIMLILAVRNRYKSNKI